MLSLNDLIFYLVVALGIIVFLKLDKKLSIVNRILVSIAIVLVFLLVFLFVSTILGIILIIGLVIFLVSFLEKRKSIFKRR